MLLVLLQLLDAYTTEQRFDGRLYPFEQRRRQLPLERNRQIDRCILWRVEQYRRSNENRPVSIDGLDDQIGGATLEIKELTLRVLDAVRAIPVGVCLAQGLLAAQVPIESGDLGSRCRNTVCGLDDA